MRIELVIDGSDYDGWGWSVYANGNQYASEIYPEISAQVALSNALICAEDLIGEAV